MGSARTIVVTALAFGCAAPAPSLSHSRQSSTTFSTTFDVVIVNGRVVDGSGAPAVRADVGVVGDRVTEVGDLSRAPAVRRIDVRWL
jgi:adenine deaminase